MPEFPNEDEEPYWLREPDSDDEDDLEPPDIVLARRKAPPEPPDDHPLLGPLCQAQDALARLEASVEASSPHVAQGLRARMAFREAAGWLAHSHAWVHHYDLALRDAHVSGSYDFAAKTGRLEAELPAMAALGATLDTVPNDHTVAAALHFAQLWRRLAEFRTWVPLSNAEKLAETLASVGWRGDASPAEIEAWLADVQRRSSVPVLLRAARTARAWMNWQSDPGDRLPLDGIVLAACVWRDKGFGRPTALPFWAAPSAHHHRLSLKVGTAWVAEFLECVARAARVGLDELNRLRQAERVAAAIGGTARSRLPEAAECAIGAPILTTRSLAKSLKVTSQAASGLLRQLETAGLLREATGRSSYRAFVLAESMPAAMQL